MNPETMPTEQPVAIDTPEVKKRATKKAAAPEIDTATAAAVVADLPGALLNLSVIQQTPMGQILKAAVRAYLAKSAVPVSSIDLGKLRFSVMVNGEHIDMPIFCDMVNNDTEAAKIHEKIASLNSMVGRLDELVAASDPERVLAAVVTEFMKHLTSVDLGKLLKLDRIEFENPAEKARSEASNIVAQLIAGLK